MPVRVAWLPEEHAGRRAARLADMMPGRDPYRPSERQQQRILARQPGRARVLVGEPATIGSLRRRWAEATGGEDPDDFGGYVARRATLALDRAEYRLRGPRYKTPSLVKEEILASRPVPGRACAECGTGRARTPPSLEEAGEILDELAAGWSRRLIDVVPTVGRLIFQRGFDPQIDYDEAQVERLRAALAAPPGHPAVVAPVEPGQPGARPRPCRSRACRRRTCSPASTWRSGRWARCCGAAG